MGFPVMGFQRTSSGNHRDPPQWLVENFHVRVHTVEVCIGFGLFSLDPANPPVSGMLNE